MQRLQAQGVELLLAPSQHGDVLLPVLHAAAVAGDAHGLENGVPELLHGLLLRHAGEHLLCPGGDGNGGDAPGEAAAHLQAVILLQRLTAHPQSAHTAVGIHALEMLRILGINGQIGSAGLGIIIEKMLPPPGHLVKHGVVGSEELLPRQIVVVPVHHHLAAAHIIGRRGTQASKKCALHGAGDDKGLPLLHMKPHFNEEPGVLPQLFVHGVH